VPDYIVEQSRNRRVPDYIVEQSRNRRVVEQEQARATEVIFLNSDYIANVQGERAESARLAFELQQARQLADFRQQQIEQAEEARQQSNALLQVLSRCYLDDIIASSKERESETAKTLEKEGSRASE
jgi:hypothetical protein